MGDFLPSLVKYYNMLTVLTEIYKPTDIVIIIGGGPSFQEIDIEKIKNKHIIGVNAAFRLGSWVDMCFTGDCRFIEWNYKELKNFPNRIITCCLAYKHLDYIETLEPNYASQKICPEQKSSIAWPTKSGGANSGASAICLAAKLGAKNIFLLGFDGAPVKGRTHWHDYHKCPPRNEVFPRYLPFFKTIAEDAKNYNIKIFNVNPDSYIPYFPKISKERFYELIS